MKKYTDRIIKILEDLIVSRFGLGVLMVLQLIVSTLVNEPMFENSFSIDGLGLIVATAFSLIEVQVSHATGKAFVDKTKRVAVYILVFVSVGFLSFVAHAQFQSVHVESKDVTEVLLGKDSLGEDFLGDTSNSDAAETRHITNTALITLLYVLAVTLSWMYYKDLEEYKPARQAFGLATVFRDLNFDISIIGGKASRADAKPEIKAKNDVDASLLALQASIEEEEDNLRQLEAELADELELTNNVRARVYNVIHAAYNQTDKS